jgi:hypothetical protein
VTNRTISINQLAEFSIATDAAKNRIIKQQIVPNKILISWYQTARATIKKYIASKADQNILNNAIELLRKKPVNKPRQLVDKKVSIEALLNMKEIELPCDLTMKKIDIVKPTKKSVELFNTEILIAPDILFQTIVKNTVVWGCIKVHISKGKPFTKEQGSLVANTMLIYLQKNIVRDFENADPDLCICLDVFSGRVISADNRKNTRKIIRNICEELRVLWAA